MPNAITPWNPIIPVRNDITEVTGELVDQRLADVEAVARWMDYAFELPGGYRFGLAGLIGLIPGIGDLIDAIISLYIVNRAIQLGVPRVAIARMMLNVGIEGLLGAIPFIGDLFDIVFKANRRNYELLKSHLTQPRAQHRSDWLFLLGTLLIVVAAVALPIWLLTQLLHHL
jgi:uncharacterized iron-regulated membrane protein